MKLVALIGSAAALKGFDPKEGDDRIVDTWNGYTYENMDTNCGMTYADKDTSMVNKTCTITIPDSVDAEFDSLYVGNGAFVVDMTAKQATVTGFDGVSTTMQYNALFTQGAAEGLKENATCWQSVVSCSDDGDFGHTDPLLMESVNANNGANKYNFQAVGHWEAGALVVSLVDDAGADLSLANVTCDDCEAVSVNGNTITFTLNDGGYSKKSTFGFSAITSSVPNAWKSSITVG